MLKLAFKYLSSSRWKHILMTKPSVVFVLGGPGAGKGTQCSKIVEKYGYIHLSAGDLLRAERKKSDSEVGQLIADYIKNGQIVPVKITCGLLNKAMTDTFTASNGTKNKFLIDGFPRNYDNLEGWSKEMDGKTNLQFVLFFKCSETICISRILDRGKTSGRTDDNMESLKKRFDTYVRETEPVINHYSSLNKVRTVNAEESEEEVFTEVCKVFDDPYMESS